MMFNSKSIDLNLDDDEPTKKRHEILDKIDSFFGNIITGFKNLIIWLPIIWNDRQWDQYFILIILRKKLSLVRDFYNSGDSFWVDAKKEAQVINRVIKSLDRVIEDDYNSEQVHEHFKKWGSPLDQRDLTERQELESRYEFRAMNNEIERLHEQDLDHIFTTMRRRIRGWWD